MGQHSPIPMPTEKAKVQFSLNGRDFKFLPGTANITESGGESPTRENVTFEGVSSLTGEARPSTLEIGVPALAPGHSSYDELEAAWKSKANIFIRYGFRDQLLFEGGDNDKVAVKKDGSLAFAAAGATPNFLLPQYGPGVALKIGNNYRVIEAITDKGVATVAPSAADVAEMKFNVVIPAYHRPSTPCKVVTFGIVGADVESEAGTTLQVQSLVPLPKLELGELK